MLYEHASTTQGVKKLMTNLTADYDDVYDALAEHRSVMLTRHREEDDEDAGMNVIFEPFTGTFPGDGSNITFDGFLCLPDGARTTKEYRLTFDGNKNHVSFERIV